MDETLTDLTEDFAEHAFLSSSAIVRLSQYETALQKNKRNYAEVEYAYLTERTHALKERYETLSRDIEATLRRAPEWRATDISELITQKKSNARLLRTLQQDLGATLSAGNWQSPSFAHSKHPEAGDEAKIIRAGMNDYKRDGHRDDHTYARAFVKTYVDSGFRPPLAAYTFSSGMAAIATALHVATKEWGARDTAIVGRGVYFQTKRLIENMLPHTAVQYIEEHDTEMLLALAKERNPRLVLLDTLANDASIATPNLTRIVPALAKIMPNGSILILDNTCLATTYQPLRDWPLLGAKPELIVLESLLKYHEFGFDRTNAGFLWTTNGTASALWRARIDMGTILPDENVLSLPHPNRRFFDARLMRIGRNAAFLARYLDTYISQRRTTLSRIIYPSLSSHPAHEWSKDRAFNGGCCTLEFAPEHRSLRTYDTFVEKVVKAARSRNMDIISGSSFGFDVTRVYVNARYAPPAAQPFVRIAAGTETMQEIQILGEILSATIIV